MKNLDINELARHISLHGTVYSRADIAAETKGNKSVDLQAIKDAEKEKRG